MHKIIKYAVVLWAWGCWAWVAYSQQWVWIVVSFIPYFLFTSFGHHLKLGKH